VTQERPILHGVLVMRIIFKSEGRASLVLLYFHWNRLTCYGRSYPDAEPVLQTVWVLVRALSSSRPSAYPLFVCASPTASLRPWPYLWVYFEFEGFLWGFCGVFVALLLALSVGVHIVFIIGLTPCTMEN